MVLHNDLCLITLPFCFLSFVFILLNIMQLQVLDQNVCFLSIISSKLFAFWIYRNFSPLHQFVFLNWTSISPSSTYSPALLFQKDTVATGKDPVQDSSSRSHWNKWLFWVLSQLRKAQPQRNMVLHMRKATPYKRGKFSFYPSVVENKVYVLMLNVGQETLLLPYMLFWLHI